MPKYYNEFGRSKKNVKKLRYQNTKLWNDYFALTKLNTKVDAEMNTMPSIKL